ncbi:MAG: spore germination protein [Clostridia bacterium]
MGKSDNKVSCILEENKNIIKKRLNYNLSFDIVIREFNLMYKNNIYNGFITYFEGMVNKDHINQNILFKMNSTFNNTNTYNAKDLTSFIDNFTISNCSLEKKNFFDKIINDICFGHVAVFVETCNVAFVCNMINYEHRNIEKPYFESSIKGPQEGFNEVLNVNTALIRKNLRDENLVIEKIQIGKRATNVCAIMYIKGLTNKKIVKNVKKRISSIDTDIIIATDTLSQYIETSTFSPIPQILPTERPDRVAGFLMQGRCVILTNNSPIAGVVPTTIIDWFHSTEDGYLKSPFNIIIKLIRILAIFAAIFLPAIYIATVTYHINVFPTNIAMTLAASRELVPIPFVVEILIMESAFELLREAEMRVPTRIGPVVSIVGGLMLGQLAVMANIICSFTMIVVGFSGIALYALPNFYVSYGLRIIRYFLIILAFLNGYLALSLGLLVFMLVLANTYSFNTRLLPSFYVNSQNNIIKELFTTPIWKNERRTYINNPQDIYSQGKISRRWLFDGKK